MIHVAAVGDIHFGPDAAGTLRPHLEHLNERADLLLLAGDLTRVGAPEEAAALAEELAGVAVPMVAVLGNHDYHSDRAGEVAAILEGIGITMLEGDSVVVPVNGATVGVAGTKGFGGGFVGACGSEFGEPEMKFFMAHSRCLAERLERSLAGLDTDVKVALLHYAPCPDTLNGERLLIRGTLPVPRLLPPRRSGRPRRRHPDRARPRPPRHRAGAHRRGPPRPQRGPTGDRPRLPALLPPLRRRRRRPRVRRTRLEHRPGRGGSARVNTIG